MELIKLTSKIRKHRGCIFLKQKGTVKYFVCKVYAIKNADEIADKIIDALADKKPQIKRETRWHKFINWLLRKRYKG